MALFQKSKNQHLQCLEKLNNPYDIKNYFEAEGLKMEQLEGYLEDRNILVSAENSVNYQDNRTYINLVKEVAKETTKKKLEGNSLSAQENQAENNLTQEQEEQSLIWNLIGGIILGAVILGAIYFGGVTLIEALTPSADTFRSTAGDGEFGNTFSTVFFSLIGGIIALYLAIIFSFNKQNSKKTEAEKPTIETNDLTKKFQAQRAKELKEESIDAHVVTA